MASQNTPSNIPDKDAPSERDQWIDAVTRLIELTQIGEIQWQVGESSAPGVGRLTTPPYYARYKHHTYKLEGRWVEPEPNTPMQELLDNFGNLARLGTTRTAKRARQVVKLDLVDNNGRSMYSVPYVSPLWDLLDVVQKQTAGDEALHDLLE